MTWIAVACRCSRPWTGTALWSIPQRTSIGVPPLSVNRSLRRQTKFAIRKTSPDLRRISFNRPISIFCCPTTSFSFCFLPLTVKIPAGQPQGFSPHRFSRPCYHILLRKGRRFCSRTVGQSRPSPAMAKLTNKSRSALISRALFNYPEWCFPWFYPVVRQMPRNTMQSRGMARTPLPRRGAFT
jgi:hypothetical protein